MLKPTKFNDCEEADCCSPSQNDYNELAVEVEDGGGGPYLVIKTERWALCADSIDLFCADLKRVLKLAEGVEEAGTVGDIEIITDKPASDIKLTVSCSELTCIHNTNMYCGNSYIHIDSTGECTTYCSGNGGLAI